MEQEPCLDGGLQGICEGTRSWLGLVQAGPHRAQVTKTEAPSEHRRIREDGSCVIGQARSATLDEGPNGRRDELGRVAAHRPHAVDLLDHAGLAVGADQLLDDEGHALRLDMNGGYG